MLIPIIIVIVVTLLLVFLNIPIYIVFFSVGLLGVWMAYGVSGLNSLAMSLWGPSTNLVYLTIPLFILMGSLLAVGGVARSLFDFVDTWLPKRLYGRAAIANLGACAVFGAVSGSASAATSTFGYVAFPEMKRLGYEPEFAAASICSGGILSAIIPPSIVMIVFCTLTGVSIPKLFMAGVVPGILLVLVFSVFAFFHERRREIARVETTTRKRSLGSLLGILPAIILMLVVLGSIWGGVATPTEAAGVGAFAAFVVFVIRKRGKSAELKEVKVAVKNTLLSSTMILMLLISGKVMGQGLMALQLPQLIERVLGGGADTGFYSMLMFVGALFFLGFFIEAIATILIVVPILFPYLIASGWNPLLIGMIAVILSCVAVFTPPVCMNVYICQTVTGVKAMSIARRLIPFIIIAMVVVGLIIAFPQIVTWLPAYL